MNIFLIRQVKKKRPLVVRLRRGVYKINRKALREMELLFKFKEMTEEENTRSMVADQNQKKQENLLPLF